MCDESTWDAWTDIEDLSYLSWNIGSNIDMMKRVLNNIVESDVPCDLQELVSEIYDGYSNLIDAYSNLDFSIASLCENVDGLEKAENA